MMNNDQEIAARGKANSYIEASRCDMDQNLKKYFSYKIPLCAKNGKIIGVFGLSYLVEGIDTSITAFNELSSLVNPKIFEKIMQSENKQETPLSTRQTDCLYYLVKGMTSKQIADKLHLSPRTIKHYLEILKIKLNCTNKAELIACAVQMPRIKNRLQ